MNKDAAIRLAALLREALKRNEQAITLIMTRENIKALYKVAKTMVTIEEYIEENNER